MAITTETIKLSGLARMLIKENQLSEEEAVALQSQADIARIPLLRKWLPAKNYLLQASQRLLL
jgi:hypothetical protein